MVREFSTRQGLGKKEVKADDTPALYHLWNDIIAEIHTEISKEDLV